MKKIVIAGGTGFLGTCIAKYYSGPDYEIRILSRKHLVDHDNIKYYKWDGKSIGYWTEALEGADVLINLNGKSVDCRYTQHNQQLIYDTRLEATYVLGKAMLACQHAPKVWLNAASATIYRHSLDKAMNEQDGEIGTGFSVDVCKKWEQVFSSFHLPETRKIALRTGIVLGRHGGPLVPLRRLAKVGMGGKHGNGKQLFSWLHETDFVRIIDFLINTPHLHGTYNITSPQPVTNAVLMKSLRKCLKMPFGLPLGKKLLDFGALLIGTETELILKSRWVVPEKLCKAGFKFSFPDINTALQDLERKV